MDDTLTFMTFQRLKDDNTDDLRDYDTIVTAQDNADDWGMVYFRPYLRTFLEAVSKAYEVVVLTAACKEYADQILNCIDPENRLIHHRLYRESCPECTPNPELPDAKVYIKDLRVLGRPLNKVILIDNSLLCFAYQLDNGIVCNPYKGSTDDRELLALLQVLGSLDSYPGADVRVYFRKMYGLGKIIHEYTQNGGRSGLRGDAGLQRRVASNLAPGRESLIDLNEPNFFSPLKSTPMKTPSRKTTPNTRYPRSGIRTSDRHHQFTPDTDETHFQTKRSLPAPPIFINTILPRLEKTSTPIASLFESIIRSNSRCVYRS
jgi:Dullard-like phosphatase family protein